MLALPLLTGCATAASSPSSCGVLFTYDRATLEQAAREYGAMKTASTFPVIRQMIDDYGTTRDTIRACGN